MLHEMNSHVSSVFITLTYNEENLPSDGSISKAELQKFFKRLRKALGERVIKYYACGEYGEESGRPHYHAIIFGVSLLERDIIQESWKFGFIQCGTVTYDSCRYVAQYVDKKYNGDTAKKVYGEKQVPFQLCSKGIGKTWALHNIRYLQENQNITVKGVSVGLPRYYTKLVDIPKEERIKKTEEREREALLTYEKRSFRHHGNRYHCGDEHRKAVRQKEMNLDSKLNLKRRNKI